MTAMAEQRQLECRIERPIYAYEPSLLAGRALIMLEIDAGNGIKDLRVWHHCALSGAADIAGIRRSRS